MKRFFSHLPACVESIGLRDLAGEREHHGDGVLGGGDRIAEGRVHHDDAARGRGGISTLSTPMPARPITFRFFAVSSIFAVALVAERMARPS
jgi:hypothetical protein